MLLAFLSEPLYYTAVQVTLAQSWCQPTSTSPLINSTPPALSPLSLFAAFHISQLSNSSMTGASLKIHHIQITLISFTLFIYFHWFSHPLYLLLLFCCVIIRNKRAGLLRLIRKQFFFFFFHLCARAEFFCSYSYQFWHRSFIRNNLLFFFPWYFIKVPRTGCTCFHSIRYIDVCLHSCSNCSFSIRLGWHSSGR